MRRAVWQALRSEGPPREAGSKKGDAHMRLHSCLGAAKAAAVAVLSAGLLGCQMPPSVPAGKVARSPATMSVDGYAMPYIAAGTGPGVVLVHGALADHRYWDTQLGSASGSPSVPLSKDFRVLAVSLRHHFPERWSGRGTTYSIGQHAADLIHFLERTQGPVHLVGHGRGGRIAFDVARARPELVRKLVMVEPALDSLLASGEGGDIDRAKLADLVEPRLRAGDVDGALAFYIDGSSGEGAWKALPEQAKQLARDNAWTLPAELREKVPAVGCAELAALRMPVLLVAGELTQPRQMRALAEAAKCMPQAERMVVSKAGHRASLDNPIGFNDAVARFLRQ